jgi:hypothetical protein
MIKPHRTARVDAVPAGLGDDAGPTAHDLAAIETEWPVIAAELDELDCVIQIVSADHPPREIDIRRYRRAQRRVLREMRTYLGIAPLAKDNQAGVA